MSNTIDPYPSPIKRALSVLACILAFVLFTVAILSAVGCAGMEVKALTFQGTLSCTGESAVVVSVPDDPEDTTPTLGVEGDLACTGEGLFSVAEQLDLLVQGFAAAGGEASTGNTATGYACAGVVLSSPQFPGWVWAYTAQTQAPGNDCKQAPGVLVVTSPEGVSQVVPKMGPRFGTRGFASTVRAVEVAAVGGDVAGGGGRE